MIFGVWLLESAFNAPFPSSVCPLCYLSSALYPNCKTGYQPGHCLRCGGVHVGGSIIDSSGRYWVIEQIGGEGLMA